MTAGFHPPLMNFRREYKHGCFKHIILMGLTEHLEFPMHAKVGVSWMAKCNCFLGFFIAIAFMWYAVVMEKSYLLKVGLSGVARLEMRHPVLDKQGNNSDCNPLEPQCLSDYKSITRLDYCIQNDEHATGCVGGKCPCRYLDSFDVLKSTNVEQRHLFLPTRYDAFDQTANCPDMNCDERYASSLKASHYIADVESFTILLDHAFVAKDVGMEKSANECVGFMRLCAHLGAEKTHVCGNVYMEGSGSALPADEIAELREIWEEFEEVEHEEEFKALWPVEKMPMISSSKGDTIFVDRLFQALDVELNDQHPMNATSNTNSLRDLGFVVMLEYEYHNWKEDSMPNSLPPVYVCSVNILKQSEYKVSSTRHTSQNSRHIEEKYGILFAVKQDGNVGLLNPRQVIFMFIELSVLLGLGKYLTLCCGLNMIKDNVKADAFEGGVMPEVPKEDEAHHFEVKNTILRHVSGHGMSDSEGSATEELLEEGVHVRRPSANNQGMY